MIELFRLAPNCKQPDGHKCKERWMVEVCHSTDHCLAMKWNRILTPIPLEINVKDIKLTEKVKHRRQDYTLYEFPVLIRKLVIGLEKGLPMKGAPGGSGEGLTVLLMVVAAEHLLKASMHAWMWVFRLFVMVTVAKEKACLCPPKVP